MIRRARVTAAAAALAGGAVAVLPDAALAHGLVGRQDLPIPRWLFALGRRASSSSSRSSRSPCCGPSRGSRTRASAACSRVPALLELARRRGRRRRLRRGRLRRPRGLADRDREPRADGHLRDLLGRHPDRSARCSATSSRAFNPWRASRAASAGSRGRVAGGRLPAPMAYPERLGRWPAAIGILAFAWVELVYVDRDDPSALAVLALALRRDPARRHEPLRDRDVDAQRRRVRRLLRPLRAARAAALGATARCTAGRPLAGAPHAARRCPGTVALLCVMIGTTSFDGFSQGDLWTGSTDRARAAQTLRRPRLLRRRPRCRSPSRSGCVVWSCIVAALFRLGIAGMSTIGGRAPSADELARRFAHTLIPIALAYVVAHYFSLLVYQGQAIALPALRPARRRLRPLRHRAARRSTTASISANGIWYVQVGGARARPRRRPHARARPRAGRLRPRPRRRPARNTGCWRSWSRFTSLGLWLLSARAHA